MPFLRNATEVEEFERSSGILLPDELRNFLLEREWLATEEYPKCLDFGWVGDPLRDEEVAKGFQWTTSDAHAAIKKRLQEDADFSYEGAVDKEHDGYLTLVHYGCGWIDCLVLTGEQRGFVWSGGNLDWHPCHDHSGRQLGFRAWYDSIYLPYRAQIISKYGTMEYKIPVQCFPISHDD